MADQGFAVYSVATKPKQAGFTLVELAIVMIIIGLLIGGILKGQELIRGAETSALVAQTKKIDTAMLSFRETYGAVPGDMPAAQAAARIPNCAGCGGGNGNNIIDNNVNGSQSGEGNNA